MTALPFFLLAVAAVLVYALARSNEKLRKREDERCKVYVEETVPAFAWPPRPKPAAHPRAHEAVVPQAGRRAA